MIGRRLLLATAAALALLPWAVSPSAAQEWRG